MSSRNNCWSRVEMWKTCRLPSQWLPLHCNTYVLLPGRNLFPRMWCAKCIRGASITAAPYSHCNTLGTRLCRVGQNLSRTIISWCTQCEVFEGALAHQSDSATFPDMFSTWLEPRAGDKVDNGTHWHCMSIMAQTVQDTCTTDGRKERLDHPRTLVARACEALRASALCGVAPLYIRVLPLGCGYIAMYTSRRRTNSPTSARIVATRGRILLVLS
ncbi:hypothetical protein EDD15DRAFT_497400 [Pisolithus albus]|nr:hypothetical protein EDD15DRAFT_497400 [Pisolithus albus]